jgi:hypothetical protein
MKLLGDDTAMIEIRIFSARAWSEGALVMDSTGTEFFIAPALCRDVEQVLGADYAQWGGCNLAVEKRVRYSVASKK